MSKELADALRATLPVLQHATLFGTPAQQADAKRRRDAAAAALVAWDTLPEAYRVEACVAIAVMEAHSIDSIIGTAQGALK